MSKSTLWPGRPWPLGAHCDADGTNFALYSAHASAVELCLFGADGRETARLALPDPVDETWCAYLPGVGAGQLYGYRVSGPYAPAQGHRFNPAKLLLDPYARCIVGEFTNDDLLLGYRAHAADADLIADPRDNAAVMPRSCVTGPLPPYDGQRRPNTAWSDTIVYELNVRGASIEHPQVAQPLRGTFSGLSSPALLEHLVTLGITAVELLPVQAFVDEAHLRQRGLHNYWGYNTIGFFVPMQRYLTDRLVVSEFRDLVGALHEAGIEVILDVVYNHTAEGNELGPTLSFRGIDNASYYRLQADNPRYYINDTGCGNSLDLNHPRVIALVMDSLRYWHETMGVDGFRFDLATALGREAHGFDAAAPLLSAIRQDPGLRQVKLIAEPWDVGPGGYRLGGFPPPFAEWNDQYRDSLRRYWRGDHGMLSKLSAGLLGSSALFDNHGRRASSSINFAASHDGFTLADTLSYTHKRNLANGENNHDGHDANFSFNCGHEGDTQDADVLDLRDRQARNLLACILLAHGTPMLLAGDEFGNSQSGNNNAYCQDNAIGWLDWQRLETQRGSQLCEFVRRLIEFRQAHPVFRRSRFLHGLAVSDLGVPSVTWLRPDGAGMSEADWHDDGERCLGLLLCGAAGSFYDDCGVRLLDDTLLIMANAHDTEQLFCLPSVAGGTSWRCEIDTHVPQAAAPAEVAAGSSHALPGQCLQVWQLVSA